jgi:hypothetical protein
MDAISVTQEGCWSVCGVLCTWFNPPRNAFLHKLPNHSLHYIHYGSHLAQIRMPGFDSRHYQKKKVVGLERVSLSLVSTTEELLDRKVAAPV